MADLESDPASRAPWPVPTEKVDPNPQPLTEGQQRILDAIPMRDPLANAVRIAATPRPRIVLLGPEPEDEATTLRARLDDALQVLRMVDDNNRVDAGEKRKAWSGRFVADEVRRVLGRQP